MNNIMELLDKDKCCGCEVCKSVCKPNAISLKSNDEGFLYPEIDDNICVKCGKCSLTCPVLNHTESKMQSDCYAGYIADKNILINSSSGGFFTALANNFLRIYPDDGYVVGVVWDTTYSNVYHFCSKDINDIAKMRGSKYIQSNKGNIYDEVLSKLESEFNVLFVGCPCEVVALKRYLKKDYERLIAVDLVCKGPTSARMWKDYKLCLEQKYKSSITSVNMRYIGWKEWIPQWINIKFSNGNEFKKIFYTTDFGRAFYLVQRKSCYSCNFRDKGRMSDITLGDFHGANTLKKYYNRLGTSIVIANSEKGKCTISNLLSKDTLLLPVNYEEIIKHNPCIIKSNLPNEKRGIFLKLYNDVNMHLAVKKTYPLKERLINYLPPDLSGKLYRLAQLFKGRKGKS